MKAIREFRNRWNDVRTSYNWGWFDSFFYALNGWILWLWYGAWAFIGWNLLDWIRYFQER